MENKMIEKPKQSHEFVKIDYLKEKREKMKEDTQ